MNGEYEMKLREKKNDQNQKKRILPNEAKKQRVELRCLGETKKEKRKKKKKRKNLE